MVNRFARLVVRACGALTASLLAGGLASAQVAGQNVNMVSGTQWPGGDPFLQRQNEPTLAVSSANPQHLLAAANDYRSVDLPAPDFGKKINGDAWLGVFKSLDGGQTWKSVLLPGYPQDPGCLNPAPPAPAGHVHHHRCRHNEASPTFGGQFALCGLPAAADPVVRAGTDGMFFVGGINFQRDKLRSRVFVARYVDANNKENGDATLDTDPIRYVDTRVIAEAPPNVFIDKPWFAVDVPRAGASTCEIPLTEDPNGPKRTFLGGTVYAAWAEFTLPDEASSTLKLTWSKDCGRTWVTPYKLNTANGILNQGISIAIEPMTGRVYVAWRRFASGKQTDAILVSRSEGRRKHFSAPRVVAKELVPFEQGTTPTSFRSEAFPSLAISTDGTSSWAHLAWPQRKANGDGRVFLSTAKVHPPPPGDQDDDEDEDFDDETRLAWSTPAPVDDAPLADDAGNAFARGHQAMPSLTFSQGRLMLVYYDTRLDHTRRYYRPRVPFAATDGRFYQEELAPLGELAPPVGAADPAAAPGSVWTPYVDDSTLTRVRHTVEIRVAVASAGPSPSFRSTQASSFPFGLRGDEFGNAGQGLSVPRFDGTSLEVVGADGTVKALQQLQHNPPNLPIFKNGTVPFMGDYIDIQGPAFVATPTGWLFNTAATDAPVFHAVWTTNQDVKVPPLKDGVPDWAGYTPIGGGGQSRYDAATTTPTCVPGYAGTRDQNIYTSRITEGLLVTSPQNAKPLSATETRTFVVVAQNTTAGSMTVDFGASSVASAAGPADVSFVNDLTPSAPRVRALRATIPAGSSSSRTLFVRSGNPSATVKATVTEACAAAPCHSGFVTLNPPVALATLLQPDGGGAPLAGGEQYAIQIMAPNVTNPNVTNPNVTNPNVTNPNVTNPNVTNPNVTNPNVTNPNVTNPNVTNPNVTNPNVTNPNVTNPNVTNPNVTNPNVTNPSVTTPNVTNAAVSDLSYTIVNSGNTTTSYRIQVVSADPSYTPPSPLQLIASKTYYTPAAVGCELKEVPHDQILVSVPDVSGALVARTDVVDPNVTDPNVTNTTLALAPGESAVITLRAFVQLTSMLELGAKVAPAAVPQAYRPQPNVTYGNIQTALPGSGVVVPGAASATSLAYDQLAGSASIAVAPAGGAGPIPTGAVFLVVNGTWRAGTANLDAAGTASISLAAPLPPGASVVAYYSGDAAYAASVSSAVVVAATTGTHAATFMAIDYDLFDSTITLGRLVVLPAPWPTGSLTFYVNGTALPPVTMPASGPTTVASPQPLAAGDVITFTYSGDAYYAPLGPSLQVTVALAPATVAVAYDLVSSRASISVQTASGSPPFGPTGTVTVLRNGVPLGSAPLVQGGLGPSSASLDVVPRLAVGDLVTVTYAGDAFFAPSTSAPLAVTAIPTSLTLQSEITSSMVIAIVQGNGLTPSGTVAVRRGGVLLGTITLEPWSGTAAGGSAVVAPPIAAGDLLVGTYSGDAPHEASAAAHTVARATSQTFAAYAPGTSLVTVDAATNVGGVTPIHTPAGAVDLSVAGVPFASVSVSPTGAVGQATGSATLAPSPPVGQLVSACYGGDAVYQPSCAPPLLLTGFASAPDLPTARRSHGTVAIGTTVYAFGGSGGPGAATSMEAFDTVTRTWSARTPAPASLSGGFGTAAAALGTKIYVFPPAAAVQVYDTLADGWTQLSSVTPGTGGDARAIELDGAIYVFYLRTQAYRYDPVADAWTALATGALADQSAQVSLAKANGKVYLFPGVAPHGPVGPFTPTLLEFDPAAGPGGAFNVMPVTFSAPINWGAAATLDGKIYALGGGAYVTNIGTVRVFDPVSQTLDDYPVARPLPTYGFGGAVVDGVFYLTGGGDDAAVAQTKVDAFFPAP